MAGRLRRLSDAERSRYFEDLLRTHYVWVGSPYGLEEEDFLRWVDDRRAEEKPDGAGA